MTMRVVVRIMCTLAAGWMLILPGTVYPCGPFFQVAVFVSAHLEDPEKYLSGNLGIIQPTYSRQDLLAAWRTLHGQPLSPSEKATLIGGPAGNPESSLPMRAGDWIANAGSLTGEKPNAGQMFAYLRVEKELKDYQFFINCNDDAFVTANKTLLAKADKYGPHNAEVKEWVRAQQMVFQNCSGGPIIPEPLPAAAPAAQRADRAYQIAAANFYAMNYDAAAEQFAAIAGDTSSPWHDYGLFLSARACIRKATVGPLSKTPISVDPAASLSRAQQLLERVIADPSLKRVHSSARGLLDFVAYQLHPQERAALLATKLSRPSSDSDFGQHVTDYLRLVKARQAHDEMAEWIMAVRDSKPGDSIAIDRWKRNPRSTAWLLAALMTVADDAPDVPALLAGALKLPAASPAYVSAQYYAARLQYWRGNDAAVRRQVDAFLSGAPRNMPGSARNAFAILRGQAAADLFDFLKFAALPPVRTGYDEDSDSALEKTCTNGNPCPLHVDPSAAGMLNHMPLAMLLQVSAKTGVPPVLRRGAALVSWERAVLLEDFSQADAAARVIAQLSTEDAGDMADYLRQNSAEAKKFAAARLMLRWPGVQPEFYTATIREDPMRTIDNFRRNWWCGIESPARPATREQTPATYPRFLSPTERARAEDEVARLKRIAAAPEYLGGIVIAWARAHRDDPRVPEALHLVVRATRYGCTGPDTGSISKSAFLLLHRNYPDNEWTMRTPYYFKD